MKIAIVEDELPTRELLKSMLGDLFQELEICGEADSVASGIAMISSTQPDIVLMDIELKDGNSFSILEQLPERSFSLIFITAFNHFAIQAFRFSACDYLLKPIHPHELSESIEKAISSIKANARVHSIDVLLENLSQKNSARRKLVLKTSESVHIVSVCDIVRAEADNNYTTFYLIDKSKILVSRTIKEYEQTLTESGFFRTHQSHLINLEYIKVFNRRDGGSLMLTDGSEIPVSSRKRQELMDVISNL